VNTRSRGQPAFISNESEVLRICGLPIADVDESGTISELDNALSTGRGGWIVTVNSDIARLCHQRSEIRETILDADLMVADGMPLIWASRIIRSPLRQRVCGSDLVWSIARYAAESGRSLFLLGGGRPETAANAGEQLQARFPALEVAGTYFPPFGFEHDEAEMQNLRQALQAANPDIVYVALGFPKAETLIHGLRESHPHAWWIGVGISLSFIAGEVPRAPRWLQVVGLEWLHRLFQEPRRLFARYIWNDIPFVIRMLSSATRQRFSNKQ
jgi:N-acetylglucosaminyldiphosphoundecaprenol N-acetyl-beta-D-mannosaminyltransferase